MISVSRRQVLVAGGALPVLAAKQRLEVSIVGDAFHLNGKPTYEGRSYQGKKIEGLLLNTRMVQATYDDANPETRSRWAYKDTGKWDPDRNLREFLLGMALWRQHGVLSFTVNFQGGSPEGYSKLQPWDNSGLNADGSLKKPYLRRMAAVLDRARELGMVPIVGIYYFGQDERLRDEAAVKAGVENVVRWLLGRGDQHVLLEINNECNIAKYEHDILKAARVHELIALAKSIEVKGRRLLVGTSYGGGFVPLPNVVKVSDYLLMHGNGVKQPQRIAEMVQQVRKVEGYRPMPIVFNEDDHFDFDKPENNMMAAIGQYASWGYFDPEGYQTPPVNWGIDTERKRGFFELAKKVTGE
jgi:hypothetical protein